MIFAMISGRIAARTVPCSIAVKAFGADMGNELMIISISACMAGGVFGDHCSPISDSTIMASAGAQCDHIQHVSTQLPYALTVAGVSFVCYILAGFLRSWPVCLLIGAAMILAVLFVMRTRQNAAAAK